MGNKAEELADSDLGAKAEQAADEAGSKLEEVSDNAQVGTAALSFSAIKDKRWQEWLP